MIAPTPRPGNKGADPASPVNVRACHRDAASAVLAPDPPLLVPTAGPSLLSQKKELRDAAATLAESSPPGPAAGKHCLLVG